jgi:tight adherence protein B
MSMITVFFILLLLVFATIAFFTEPSEAEKRTAERLDAISRPPVQDDDVEAEIVKRRVSFSRIGWLDHALRQNKPALQLHLWLEQAQVPWTVGRFFFYSACLLLVGALIGNWWIPVGIIGWIPGIALGFLPLAYVGYKRNARFRLFNSQLPEAVDLIARALRAGQSLPGALMTVAEEIDEPLGPEFQTCGDEMNYGLPFREAMNNLLERFPVTELQFLVSAMLVQRETGGNLPELLDKTAAVLRSRIQLQQKVRVYTAQGRMTGAILLALPFIAFVLTNLMRPGYTEPLFETEAGHKLIYFTLISMALGTYFIRKIIRVKY